MSVSQLYDKGIPGPGGAIYLKIYIQIDSGEYVYIQDDLIEIKELSEPIEPIIADELTMEEIKSSIGCTIVAIEENEFSEKSLKLDTGKYVSVRTNNGTQLFVDDEM